MNYPYYYPHMMVIPLFENARMPVKDAILLWTGTILRIRLFFLGRGMNLSVLTGEAFMRAGRRSKKSGCLIWHSQTTISFQPSILIASAFFLSRVTFCSNFVFQKAIFELGMVASLHPGWRCQKHPRTSMTVLYFGKTMSGCPGRFFTCRWNRNPCIWRNERTTISGLVSWEWILLIFQLRCSGDLISMIKEVTPWKRTGDDTWGTFRVFHPKEEVE